MSGGPIADNAPEDGFEYDLIVIGGGSGGLSVSKEAASLGKKVRGSVGICLACETIY